MAIVAILELDDRSTNFLQVPEDAAVNGFVRMGMSPRAADATMHFREGVIIADIINLWNAFGKPVCVFEAKQFGKPGDEQAVLTASAGVGEAGFECFAFRAYAAGD